MTAQELFSFQASAYGPLFAKYLAPDRLASLGPGRADESLRQELRALTLERLFAGRAIRDHRSASCCLAALWLRFDFLEESHSLSQEIETAEGSYWHGIMHRREPDYSNAKYWFRRVGKHPIFPRLAVAATQAALAAGRTISFAAGETWDPYAFIDCCEEAARGGRESDLLREIADREWKLLFAHCFDQAIDPV